ncbi:MAG TPA: hypothetical protein VGR04_14495, partial [Acidimicrobiia bacterium]|nr:hypothetical protein [Acidimicrobiia bacterium]
DELRRLDLFGLDIPSGKSLGNERPRRPRGAQRGDELESRLLIHGSASVFLVLLVPDGSTR